MKNSIDFDTSKLFYEGVFYIDRLFCINPFANFIIYELKILQMQLVEEHDIMNYLFIDDYGKVGILVNKETSNVITNLFLMISKTLSIYNNLRSKENKTYPLDSKTYLMYDGISRMYKIGKSKNPKIREKTLCAQMPKITLFAVCNYNCEKEMHKKYSIKRQRGEWFKLSNDDLKDIFENYDFEIE